jgi:hypothetical protein
VYVYLKSFLPIWVMSLAPESHNEFDCGGAVPYGGATADSADAAQVDRVNVESGFRQTQKLKVVKSTKRSEISRPNFDPCVTVDCSFDSLNSLFLANFRKVSGATEMSSLTFLIAIRNMLRLGLL